MDREKSDQDQKLEANNLQKEIEKLRFELEKQRLDDFNLRGVCSSFVSRQAHNHAKAGALSGNASRWA
jgi:hypothetical protein